MEEADACLYMDARVIICVDNTYTNTHQNSNWGVLPILVFVLAVNLIRAYLQLLGKTDKPLEKEELRRK